MNRKLWLRVSNVFSFSLVFFQLSTISGVFIKRQIETNAVCKSEGCVAAAEQLKISIDETVEPCDDFFQYTCGNWPKNYCKTKQCNYSNKLRIRNEQNDKEIIEFLSQKNNEDEPEALHKARKLYSMCLSPVYYKEENRVNNLLSELGLPMQPLNPCQKENAKLFNSSFDYAITMAKMARIAGIKTFAVEVAVNPYNLNENLILLFKPNADLMAGEIVESNPTIHQKDVSGGKLYTQYMEKIMKILYEDENLSQEKINCTFNLTENQMMKKVLSRHSDLEQRKKSKVISLPVLYTLEELQKMSDDIADEVQSSIPKLNFTSYIEELFSGIENSKLDLRNASDVRVLVEENYIRFAIEFLYKFNIQELGLKIEPKSEKARTIPLAEYREFRSIGVLKAI